MDPLGPTVRVAVEGQSDTGMAQALLDHVGLHLEQPCLVKRGARNLDRIVPGLAGTGIYDPWIVFRDADAECPVRLRRMLIGDRPHGNRFELRIACSMTESWLIADRVGFARYFKVPDGKVPTSPDDLPNAKRALVAACQASRLQAIRRDVVGRDGSPGPLYGERLNEFARSHWDIGRAEADSPSLARAVRQLSAMREELVATTTG